LKNSHITAFSPDDGTVSRVYSSHAGSSYVHGLAATKSSGAGP
jgi:hypothetical protein